MRVGRQYCVGQMYQSTTKSRSWQQGSQAQLATSSWPRASAGADTFKGGAGSVGRWREDAQIYMGRATAQQD